MEMEFINGCCADESGRRVLDPTVYQDWQIGAAAEETLPDVETFRERLGLKPEELLPYGKGKSTTSLGLIEGLGRLGKNVAAVCASPPAGRP